MTDRAVSVARDWLGTPYIHQASQKGGEEPEAAPDYTPDWGEFGSHELLMDGAMRHMLAVERAAALAPGQVLLFRMRAGAVAKHLGIVSAAGDAPRFIHAYTHHGVIDSPLTAPWRNRIAARFRFP